MENSNKPVFLKEVKKLWEEIGNSSRNKYSLLNTLLIDDEPYKALLNHPHSAIFLNEYKAGEKDVDDVLGPNGELRQFLYGLAETDDVPSYVKENNLGIGQPAITPSHPDWRFYSPMCERRKVHSPSAWISGKQEMGLWYH